MNTAEPEIKPKSAGPEGASIAFGEAGWSSGLKIRLVSFMREDYIDAAEARAALNDPENRERVPWKTLKEKFGL